MNNAQKPVKKVKGPDIVKMVDTLILKEANKMLALHGLKAVEILDWDTDRSFLSSNVFHVRKRTLFLADYGIYVLCITDLLE